MDPVTAFSLAAGVLQVLDLSFKALSKCKEIYKDGSLAQHRDAMTITKYLAETTKRLETSIQSASNPVFEQAEDVIGMSKECSATATALLSELEKLQLKPGSSLFQAFKKTTRAVRRKAIIAETEKKLEKYQNILNTRILSKLDAHAIQQIEQSRTLDQSVKDLAIALSQGRNTVAQLLADQTVIIQGHIDRRFDDQAFKKALQIARQRFKDSLFFPEISARQDDIPKSHERTCHWIFDSPRAISSNISTDGDPTRNAKARPWFDFIEWLENDQDTYCTLQKNYVGALRSLLYQIAEQREDLIPMIMGQEAISEARTSHPREPVPNYAWTKERLDDALRRFLSAKPSSISVCLFIDGLDEFVGDEDLLMETIRLLSRTPRTHVCVSSRPEQIFRQDFANSPQLRLQDLNYEDIEKATKDRLDTTLKEIFLKTTWMIDGLVANVIAKAQGIFLWADLVTKDLLKGARNSDSTQELHERLDSTPSTIEGLYEHMLERLDKSYFQDAARYFQPIMANQDYLALESDEFLGPRIWSSVLTLLHCACVDEEAWDHVLSHDLEYFQSPEFHDLCRNLETRILTRCAGLVEVSEHRGAVLEGVFIKTNNGELSHDVRTNQGTQNTSYYLREVKLIHKTVMDFLQSHEEFFQDPNWRLTATATITRGNIGVVGLTPIIICEEDALLGPFMIGKEFILNLLSKPSWIEVFWPPHVNCQATHDTTIQVIHQAYEVLSHVSRSLNGLDHNLFDTLSGKSLVNMNVPFHDGLGFAAFFGRHDYVSRYTARTNQIQEDAEYVLCCTISGLYSLINWTADIGKASLAMEGYFRIVMDFLPRSTESQLCIRAAISTCGVIWESKWVIFLNCSLQLMENLLDGQSQLGSSTTGLQLLRQATQSIRLWTETVACFLNHNADSNTILEGDLNIFCSDTDEVGNSTLLSFTAAETLLACVRRTFQFAKPALKKDLEDLLRSHGGQHRRTFLSFNINKDKYYLTREQSDRLLNAWSFEDGSLPAAVPSKLSVKVEKEEQELVNPDPTTERKLTLLLENIDRSKIKRNKKDLVVKFSFSSSLDFESQ